jgi:hypothetical protein
VEFPIGSQAMSLWDPRNVPPYPAARYPKDEPKASAWLRASTRKCWGQPDYNSFGLVKYHYLANQKQTDGDRGLYRVEISPNGWRTGTAISPGHVGGLRRAVG